jgi:hypothetical protein
MVHTKILCIKCTLCASMRNEKTTFRSNNLRERSLRSNSLRQRSLRSNSLRQRSLRSSSLRQRSLRSEKVSERRQKRPHLREPFVCSAAPQNEAQQSTQHLHQVAQPRHDRREAWDAYQMAAQVDASPASQQWATGCWAVHKLPTVQPAHMEVIPGSRGVHLMHQAPCISRSGPQRTCWALRAEAP